MACRSVIICVLVSVLLSRSGRTDESPKTVKLEDRVRTRERLAQPVSVEVDGQPLVRDELLIPFMGDLDGDGRHDLLLGTRSEGRLLVYRNVGSKGSVKLEGPRWFDETVPTGRIPSG